MGSLAPEDAKMAWSPYLPCGAYGLEGGDRQSWLRVWGGRSSVPRTRFDIAWTVQIAQTLDVYRQELSMNHPINDTRSFCTMGADKSIRIKTIGTNMALGLTESAARRIKDIIKSQKDRKSTRLNSSHVAISYAVFCLKKKNKTKKTNSGQCSQTKQSRTIPRRHRAP